jgi:hypothetical protein
MNRLACLGQAVGIATNVPEQTVVDEFGDGGLNVVRVKAHEACQDLRVNSTLAAHLLEYMFLNFG